MKVRGLVVALVLLAALGGFVYWNNKHPKTDAEAGATAEPKPTELFAIKRGDVASVDIQREQGPLTVKLDGSAWRVLVGPESYAADGKAIDQMFASINPLTTRRIFTGAEAKPTSFGLDHPSSQVIVHLKNGGTKVIAFGDELPTGGERYAQIAGESRIVIINANEYFSLNGRPEQWRDKRLLPVNQAQIKSLTIQTAKDTIVLTRDDPGSPDPTWQMLRPASYPVAQGMVDNLLSTLEQSKAQQIPQGEEARNLQDAFAAATLVSTLEAQLPDGAQRVEVRTTKTGDYLAKSTTLRQPVKLDLETAQGFAVTPASLWDPAVFGFGIQQVEAIDINEAGKLLSLAYKNNKWWRDGRPMDSVSVQNLIDHLRDLKAKGFPANGANARTVTITVAWNGQRQTVDFTPQGDRFLARRAGDPRIYEVSANDVATTRGAWLDIRPEAPRPPAPAKK